MPELNRIWDVYERACDLDGAEREAWLTLACAEDAVLRREVVRRLAIHDVAGAEAPGEASRRVLEGVAGRVLSLEAGTRIGAYEVMHQIGAGGMGQVYEVLQLSTQRRVALKLLPVGFDTPERLARFEREIRALSQLDHPGIVHILDAGQHEETSGARPFFTMELVDGSELGAWPHRENPDLRSRLILLQRLSEAVDHAHRRGWLHRDLKPANILVDRDENPRILDFGIARMLHGDGMLGPGLTRTGDVVGTPTYMSPEQLAGDSRNVEVRSDVYALGVIAYELISGQLPHDSSATPAAVSVRMREPPLRLGSISRAWHGDLDTIVGKALEPDPESRYASAGELAADLARLLDRRPIHARPPSMTYRMRLWVRRRPLAAAFVGLLVLAVPFLADWVASRTMVLAFERQQLAEALEDDLALGFLALGDSNALEARETFERILDRQSTVEALAGLALAYLQAGDEEAALELLSHRGSTAALEPSLRIIEVDALRRLGRNVSANVLEAEILEPTGALADYLAGTRALERGLATRETEEFRRASGLLHRAVLSLERPRALYHFQYAQALWRAGDAEAVAGLPVVLRRMWPDSALAAYWGGCCLSITEDHEGAEEYFRRALDLRQNFVRARGMLGLALGALGELEEAAGCHEWVMEHAPERSEAPYNLALVRIDQGRNADALALLEMVCAARPEWGAPERVTAIALMGLERLAEALPHAERATEFEPGNPLTHRVLGMLRSRLGDPGGAEQALRDSYSLDPGAMETIGQLAAAFLDQGKLDEALVLLDDAVERHPEDARMHEFRGTVKWALADWPGANADFEAYLRLVKPNAGSRRLKRMHDQVRIRVEQLDRILLGRFTPQGPDEALELAEGCYELRHYRAAVGYSITALEGDPALQAVPSVHRYNAACSAALASCGAGLDSANLLAPERAELRARALVWLRQDLAALLSDHDLDLLRTQELAGLLDGWLADRDLASVRPEADSGGLHLPEAEREAWESFWRQVRELRAGLDE